MNATLFAFEILVDIFSGKMMDGCLPENGLINIYEGRSGNRNNRLPLRVVQVSR
jgi:hypothetical protein